jgi:hypothetical protein
MYCGYGQQYVYPLDHPQYVNINPNHAWHWAFSAHASQFGQHWSGKSIIAWEVPATAIRDNAIAAASDKPLSMV